MMLEAVARDIVQQYFRVLKKNPNAKISNAVTEALELLGEEVVQDIQNRVNNE